MVEAPHFRMPKNGEVFGYVTQLLGFGRMYVKCSDDKTRLCVIKGSISRYLWVREGDIVIVKPWDIEKDKKGDVMYKYEKNTWDYLRSKGVDIDKLIS
ncbi:translation initiation factor eIF-1A [Candidatus Parvarchaeota archaeon]|jgi:translation initiation factor 1A|uniref:Translation initiation factor 1A n=1 Tax=Candidatus Acidifodinimicrobium mancum TaxID=2898728 RepID=A0A8T3UU56_9ARCH|nr:translation initiation factor eIF-1A [Candidatus Acidifodinimicrobium mancum]MBE5729659.1 translation initiation factor eIF-1A [Candidatus Acidifodinimicrobium mancum]MBE5730000.1 translation initiation factor eIF-1A [Candidatus Acidifodinimicrobium mancum]